MYQIRKIALPIAIDGDLTKDVWKQAEKSPRFVDAVGGTPGIYDTRAAILWDEEALYIGFWAEEPYPAATLTKRDSLLWVENDLEVFIAGPDTYYELELNALGTLYEVFYLWRDAYPRLDAKGKLIAGYSGTDEHLMLCGIGGPLPRETGDDMHSISYFDRIRPELF